MTAEELKAWRERMAWTQEEAARQLGYRRPYYTTLEGGKQPIARAVELATAALEHGRKKLRLP